MEVERTAMREKIQAEPPGDYFVGRRYYKPEFHFWGYVRKPGQPWNSAQLVILNEKKVLAPDREHLNIGSVSNRVLPEFVLEGYELISTHPAPIFPSQFRGRAGGQSQIERPE
jgi:hypothetical protein